MSGRNPKLDAHRAVVRALQRQLFDACVDRNIAIQRAEGAFALLKRMRDLVHAQWRAEIDAVLKKANE